MKLWGIGTSRTFRAHFALQERGLEYETVRIRTRTKDQERSDFRAVAVSAKVPAFEDGDLVINESAAIARYVMHRGRPPLPAAEQAFCDQWSYFIVSELDATALYVLRRHRDLWEIYGKAEAAVESAEAYFERQITSLSETILDGREFALPNEFTEVDILLISILDWAAAYRLPLPENALAYGDGIRKRDAYVRAREINYG